MRTRLIASGASDDVARGIKPSRSSKYIRLGVAALAIVSVLIGVAALNMVSTGNAQVNELERAAQRTYFAERANGLIYSVVADSRGIYMSADAAAAAPYGAAVLHTLRELSANMTSWRTNIHPSQRDAFARAEQRVDEFIRYRSELARRGMQIGPAAARSLGDNEENRRNRKLLNAEIDHLATTNASELAKLRAAIQDQSTRNFVLVSSAMAGAMLLASFLVVVLVLGYRKEAVRQAALNREINEARDAAEEATTAKSAFLANMSHEIRTPLNSIIGFTDLLLEDTSLDSSHRRKLDLIQTSGSALLTVVDDILDLSKLEAGKVELDCRPFALVMFLDNAISIVQRSAEAKGLEMHVSIDPQLSSFHLGDENRLRQILLNLINNAVKFTTKGSISVGLTWQAGLTQSERVRFEIVDTGAGISEEKQARLFQQFTQADSSISREYGGTGLGLAISKSLVEVMNGEIGVVSTEGEGATFWFEINLPITERPSVAAVESVYESRTATILLAEDLPINQELACALLSRAGHRIDVAANGAEALRMVQEKRYDLILMDIQMPKMDGISATKAIRSLAGPVSKITIVAMTANVLPDQVKEFTRAGMDGFIAKPIKQAQLHEEIARALGRAAHMPATEEAALRAGAFDRDVYSKIATLLPQDRLRAHLASFEEQMRELETEEDLDGLKGLAHKLVSQAGMLGFADLSQACRNLEEAIDSKAHADNHRAAAGLSAKEALIITAELKDELAEAA